MLCMMSGDTTVYRNLMATLDEVESVETAFEDFRAKVNQISIQHPQHSVFPQVLSMVETMIGPMLKEEPDSVVRQKIEKDFAESLKITIETFMPWERLLGFSRCGDLR